MISDKAKLALTLISLNGIGPKTIKQLIAAFKSIEEIQEASERDLRKSLKNVSPNKIQNAVRNEFELSLGLRKAEQICYNCEIQDISIHCTEDSTYPKNLKLAEDSPPIIYSRGGLNALEQVCSLAIVGTRKPTNDGVKMAERIAARFSEYGFNVVSGLAFGIDTIAHEQALKFNASTIAVMGTNLEQNSIYPKKNLELAQEILEKGGAWISELAPNEKSESKNFALRDRIQSGLSLAVIPIQTDLKGGTMHTVRFALAQGRPLFAPEPHDKSVEQSEGIEHIIQNGSAISILSKFDYPIIALTLQELAVKYHGDNGLGLNLNIIQDDLELSVSELNYNSRLEQIRRILAIKPNKHKTDASKMKKSTTERAKEKLSKKLDSLLDEIARKEFISDIEIQGTLRKYLK